MRVLVAIFAAIGLLSLSMVAAHGDGPKTLLLTDQGCSLTDPPCFIANDGATVEAGSNTVQIKNSLATTAYAMIHLDAKGSPGAMIAGAEAIAPGATVAFSFDVPADSTGVWFMALEDGEESARLYGGMENPHTEASKDSPGVGAALLLGVLGLFVIASRRS